jgi:RND superfamily putative drug exporter
VLNDTLGKDFKRAEYSSLPVTLIILLLAFGALVAAGLPVLLAFSGVLATVGLSSIASHVVPAGDATQSVILLIGMAVGVDYSLFYIRREREERSRGLGHREALLRTAGTSGYAVLISGITVLIAMAGMLLTGNAVFTSIAVGAMLMVAVALIGSLSILPALLSRLGDRVNKGRIPVLARRGYRESASGDSCSNGWCGGRGCPRSSPAGCCSRSLSRRCSCTRSSRASPTCPGRSGSCAPTRRSRRRSRARRRLLRSSCARPT